MPDEFIWLWITMDQLDVPNYRAWPDVKPKYLTDEHQQFWYSSKGRRGCSFVIPYDDAKTMGIRHMQGGKKCRQKITR